MEKDFQPIRNLIIPAVGHLRTAVNNLNAGVIRNEVVTTKNPDPHPEKKWLINKFTLPKFARFKLVIEYKTGKKIPYPSVDYQERYENKVLYKIQSEEQGYLKLLKSKMVRQTPYENYWRIVIYANLTNDLRYPDSWAYDHKVIDIERGLITATYMILRYRTDGKLDVQKTLLDTETARSQGLIKTPFKK